MSAANSLLGAFSGIEVEAEVGLDDLALLTQGIFQDWDDKDDSTSAHNTAFIEEKEEDVDGADAALNGGVEQEVVDANRINVISNVVIKESRREPASKLERLLTEEKGVKTNKNTFYAKAKSAAVEQKPKRKFNFQPVPVVELPSFFREPPTKATGSPDIVEYPLSPVVIVAEGPDGVTPEAPPQAEPAEISVAPVSPILGGNKVIFRKPSKRMKLVYEDSSQSQQSVPSKEEEAIISSPRPRCRKPPFKRQSEEETSQSSSSASSSSSEVSAPLWIGEFSASQKGPMAAAYSVRDKLVKDLEKCDSEMKKCDNEMKKLEVKMRQWRNKAEVTAKRLKLMDHFPYRK